MTKIPLGKVAFTDKGSYSNTVKYARLDFITTDDSCYLSLKDENTGHALTDTAWWKCIARGTTATEASKKANTAAALANEKATAADVAAGRVSDAIGKANTAAVRATEKAAAAENASGEATEKIADMNVALARLEELEHTLTAQARQQPTAMTLNYPRKITKGNKNSLKIAATLSPAGTGSNVLFLGDDKAVTVAPNGFLIVNEVGKSKIHVIPTENTDIYRTIEIEVVPVSVRLHTKTALRLMANGNFRLS